MKQIQRRTSVSTPSKMLSRRQAEMHQVNILWSFGAVCGSNFSILFLVPLMPGFTHHERKTFYKLKQELSHLLTLEIKNAPNLQTPWVVALWAYLRSGSTQSECFNNHWPACTSTWNGLKVFIFVLVLCFFKLQFTIGNNILYCDLVYTVYRLFNNVWFCSMHSSLLFHFWNIQGLSC